MKQIQGQKNQSRLTAMLMFFLFTVMCCCPGKIIAQSMIEGIKRNPNNAMGFVENKGQIVDQHSIPNQSVKYLLNMPGLNVQLKANSFSYDAYMIGQQEQENITQDMNMSLNDKNEFILTFHRIDIEFIGANSFPQIIGEEVSSDYLNFYTPGTSEEGAIYIKHYQKITYKNLYSGIDLVFFARPGTTKPVEYTFILHPGADISQLRWRYTGSESIKLQDGNICIQTSKGMLKESIPFSWENETGKAVEISYQEYSPGIYTFKGQYDAGQTLVIDPIPNIVWATYYGGALLDAVYGVSIDQGGNVCITGTTTSTTNIATTGAHQSSYSTGTPGYGWGGDAFVVKFSPTGTRLWGTYYGGSGNTYNEDNGKGIVTNKNGDIYVEGLTTSQSGIATTGAFMTTAPVNSKYGIPFLVKFNSSGVRQWGTYFGDNGNGSLSANCVTIDTNGNVYFAASLNYAGNTSALTSTGCYQAVNSNHGSGNMYNDCILAKFNSSGSRTWATFYGGYNPSNNPSHDSPNAIAVDDSGNVYLTGMAACAVGISTTGAYQSTKGGTATDGITDAFIAKFNSTGTKLIWATYYGGTGTDVGMGIVVDHSGNVYVSGYTASTGTTFASSGAFQTSNGGSNDGWLAKFSNVGQRIWGTYFGGTGSDVFNKVSLNAQGELIVTGYAASSGLSTTGAYQTTFRGGTNDAIIAKFNASTGNPVWCTYYGDTLSDAIQSFATDPASNIVVVGNTLSLKNIATTGAHQTTYGGGTNEGFVANFREQNNYIMITSATTIQPDTTSIQIGSTNKMIIGVKINTKGASPFAKVTRFSFDTAGAFNYSNIIGNAKVYYTGNSATFSTSKLFDSTTTTPSAAFTISGNQVVDTGIVYFWLTFNVSSSAAVGNYLDAKCTQVRWDSAGTSLYLTPVIISPAGRRMIAPASKKLSSIGYTQPSTSDVYLNSVNNTVIRIDLDVFGTADTLKLNQITVSAKNTNNSDVTFVKLYATTTTTFSTSSPLGSSATFTSGIATFSSLNYSLPTGKTYIWVTYNISSTANLFDTVDAKIPVNGITIGSFSYPDSVKNPTGYRIINTNHLYDAGITAITSPSAPYCKTGSVIKVILKNFGSTTMTNNTIKWSVNGSTPASYSWSGSLINGNSAEVTIGSYTFNLGTPYTIKVYSSVINGTHLDSFPGNDTAIKTSIIYNAIPVAGFTINNQTQCFNGHLFIFTNTSSIVSGTFTSSWNFGDTSSSTLASPSHKYLYVDTFPVKLVVSSVSGCTDSIILNTSLLPSPKNVSFSINDTSQCLGNNSFIFTNTSTGQSGNYWSFGDTTFSTLTSPATKTYIYRGTKSVKLVISNTYNCKDSITKSVYVWPQPIAKFTINDTAQCLHGNYFVITNTSSGQTDNYWDFGDTTFSSAASPAPLTYKYSGIKSVKLVTETPYGCKDSFAKNIYVWAHAKTGFSVNSASQCLRSNSFVFTNTSTGQTTNNWSFGDTTFSSIASPAAKSYLYIGSKTVKLVTNNTYGCKDSIINIVYVRPHPVTGFTVNKASQCLRGNSFIFTNTSTGQTTNKWSFGDTTYSTLLTPLAKKYLYIGTKSVKLVTSNTYGCKDSITNNVDVNPHPITGFTINNSSQCLRGNSFVFTNTSAGQTNDNWSFGDTTFSTLNTPLAKKYLFSGTKSVKLVTTNTFGCKDSITHLVDVRPHPVTGFGINNTSQCLQGNSFVFINTSTGQTTNNWSFGDTTFSTLAFPTVKVYLYSGTYSVKLVTTNTYGCKDSIINNINVRPHPISGFTINNASQCLRNNSFVYINTSTGQANNYWSFGDTTFSPLASPPAKTYLYLGSKTVKLVTASSYGCMDSITKNVDVNPHPISGFNVNILTQCLKGNLFLFTNSSAGQTANLWSFGDTTFSALDSPVAKTYLFSGTKSIKLITVNSYGCMDSIINNVIVNPNPAINLGKDTTVNDNKSITLDAGAGYDSYLWSNNDTTQTINVDTNGIGLSTKLFWVKVGLNDCYGYDSINITFKKHVSVNDQQLSFNIRIFPNPTRDFINIEPDFMVEDMAVTLTEMNGKWLKTIRMKSFNEKSHYQMDITELAKGVYFLNITNANLTKVVKIIKY